MKRLLTTLLVSLVTFVMAMATTEATAERPVGVITVLNKCINQYGTLSGGTFSVERDPVTNQLVKSVRVTHFQCERNDRIFADIAHHFQADEKCCYKLAHLPAGSGEMVDLLVAGDDQLQQSTLHLRTKQSQEMWLMCAKTPDNPQLRDAYAIVWEETGGKVDGYIYLVTSLRPDIYQKRQEERKSKMFDMDNAMMPDMDSTIYRIDPQSWHKDLPVIPQTDSTTWSFMHPALYSMEWKRKRTVAEMQRLERFVEAYRDVVDMRNRSAEEFYSVCKPGLTYTARALESIKDTHAQAAKAADDYANEVDRLLEKARTCPHPDFAPDRIYRNTIDVLNRWQRCLHELYERTDKSAPSLDALKKRSRQLLKLSEKYTKGLAKYTKTLEAGE